MKDFYPVVRQPLEGIGWLFSPHLGFSCIGSVFYDLWSVAIVLYVAVMFAYEQCLLVLGHHPDIWYEAAQYLEQSSKLLAEKGVWDLKKTTFQTLNLVYFWVFY